MPWLKTVPLEDLRRIFSVALHSTGSLYSFEDGECETIKILEYLDGGLIAVR